MTLPALPSAVWSPLGPIPVVMVPALADETGKPSRGLYDPNTRVVSIEPTPVLVVRWQTLEHEWVHSVLDDHGFDLGAIEEGVIDTIATALVARLLAGQAPALR